MKVETIHLMQCSYYWYYFSRTQNDVILTLLPNVHGGPKIGTIFVRLKFAKYYPLFTINFTVRIRRKCVIILSLKIPPHLKCVATLSCEVSNILKATIENKTTSATTHFKKRGNNVFIVSVIV